jgi:putative ABC transport system permease protein
MFFVTFLGRELWRRRKQAVVIALGLAVGIGLVITVTAAAAGVRAAQASVLRSLYGVGTDITVTTKPAVASPGGRTRVNIGPGGSQVCHGNKCHQGATKLDNLVSASYGPMPASDVAKIRALEGVTGAAGGLTLNDTQISIPASVATGGSLPQPRNISVDGADLTHPGLGPLSTGRITKGRNLAGSDAHANVAVVDSNYATASKLKPGGTITIAKTRFTIVGIVSQPQGASPANAYIPLARAQALARSDQTKRLTGQVNSIYVAASSAAVVPAVAREISRLMPKATVTTSASLASQVTGSLSSTARLANQLGRWLSVLVLAAAVAVASLLTVAAVSRRVREFGTLKALGWRSTRIIAQVMGESLVLGLAGGAAGVGLGYAGAAIITRVAPKLSATLNTPAGPHFSSSAVGPGGVSGSGPAGGPAGSGSTAHTVLVPMSAPVSVAVIAAAVLLALAGGLIAGSFGSWRIAQLRPAAALARVD